MRRISILSIASVSALSAAADSHAAIIYSAFSNFPNGLITIHESDETDSAIEIPGVGREEESRIGDFITFGGTDRFVTDFAIRLERFPAAGPPVTFDAELSIYSPTNDGLPDALLWSGTRTGIVLGQDTTRLTVNFQPNLTLPDSVCFALAYRNIDAGGGSAIFGANVQSAMPSVGSSPRTVISQLTPTGEWVNNIYPPGVGQLQALVTAIPAPGFASLAVIGLCMGRRRR